ncbi:MAG TPA: hypothetical protein VN023_08940 [Methylovorus sp.]|jgi:hypothetical protein|nr:hypothetical protein [Methylovorus sp.]
MYIVAIAWLYVTVLMAATEPSVVAGILTFVFYGLLPCALLLWLFGTPQRRRRKLAQEKAALLQEKLGKPDRGNTQNDQ